MQPRRLLATFVIRVHCWLVDSCFSIRTPKSFRAVLQPVSPQHVLVPGVIPPLVQGLAFPSVKLQKVAINPISSLSRLLWMAAQPSGMSAAPPGFVPLRTCWGCNLPLQSRSLMKMLNKKERPVHARKVTHVLYRRWQCDLDLLERCSL